MEKISVIIPLYNKAQFIAECIDSVLAQSYSNFDLIIVDDCSTDGSQDIVRSYSDPRILFYENKQNLGTAGNGNRCFDLANTRFVIRQDADDIMPKDRIAIQISYLTKEDDVAILGGLNSSMKGEPLNQIMIESHNIISEIFFTNPVSQPTSAYNTYLIKKYDLRFQNQGPNIGEDWIFLYNVSKHCKVINIPEIFNVYRIHENNISNIKGENYFNDIRKVLGYILKDNNIPFTQEELGAHFLFRKQIIVHEKDFCSLIDNFYNWQKKLTELNSYRKFIDENYLLIKIQETINFLFFRIANDKKAIKQFRKYWKMDYKKWRYLLSLRFKS